LSDPIADLKEKAKATWALGSYNDIATFLSPMSAHLVRAASVSRGELDVACGTGITAITACRAGGKVIGIDLTPELLARAKEEAALAGVTEGIEWKHGDAEDLPFPDNSFDIVLSSLGHMFTPRPESGEPSFAYAMGNSTDSTGASRQRQRQGPSLRTRCRTHSCIEPKPFLAIV
jgi:SAM-dependent methyltransferase